MTPTVGVKFGAAADGRQFIVDADCTLIGISSAAAAASQAVVSRDSATTIANAVTGGTGNDENIIACTGRVGQGLVSVPLSAGQSVYVSASGAMLVVLQFQLNQ